MACAQAVLVEKLVESHPAESIYTTWLIPSETSTAPGLCLTAVLGENRKSGRRHSELNPAIAPSCWDVPAFGLPLDDHSVTGNDVAVVRDHLLPSRVGSVCRSALVVS
jgi:hypothetical protein